VWSSYDRMCRQNDVNRIDAWRGAPSRGTTKLDLLPRINERSTNCRAESADLVVTSYVQTGVLGSSHPRLQDSAAELRDESPRPGVGRNDSRNPPCRSPVMVRAGPVQPSGLLNGGCGACQGRISRLARGQGIRVQAAAALLTASGRGTSRGFE